VVEGQRDVCDGDVPVKVERPDLLAALRLAYGTMVRHVMHATRLPFDLPAALLATVLWESGGRLGAVGDNGASHGLAQIHAPSHPDLPAFALPERAEGESDRAYLLRALGYELAYMRPVVVEMLEGLRAALKATQKRVEAGERIRLNVARDLPVWWSIQWQYGPGAFARWISSPQAVDLSPAGFKAFRRAHGLAVLSDFERRQQFFAETYLHNLESPDVLLDALRDESISSGVDYYSRAARTLGAASEEIEGWLRTTGKDLLFPWLPDGRDVALGLGSVALLAFVGYELLTVKTKGGGREFRPEVKAKVKEVATVAAPALLAKLLL
jgi:hypothetical protein